MHVFILLIVILSYNVLFTVDVYTYNTDIVGSYRV